MRKYYFILLLLSALACLWAGAVIASESEMEVSGEASVTFEGIDPDAGVISATVRWVNGDALVKRSGSVVWEVVEAGMELKAGDVLETREGASVLLAVGDWSYIKPSPMSVVSFQVARTDDKVFRLVALDNGKLWGSLKRVEEDEDPLVIQMPGGFVDGKEGTFFIEANPKDSRACVDMLRGELNIRSAAFPDRAVPLTKDSRAQIKPGQEIGEPEKIGGKGIKENDANHTCLAAQEKKEEKEEGTAERQAAAEEREDGSVIVTIGGNTLLTVEGSGESKGKSGEMEEMLDFGGEGEGKLVMVPVVGKGTVTFVMSKAEIKLSDDDAVEFVMTEEQAEEAGRIIEINAETSVEFKNAKAEEVAGDCAVSGISISSSESGVEVSGTTISAYVCGEATLLVEPSQVVCGAGAKYDGWAMSVNGGAPATYAIGTKAELKYKDTTVFNLKVNAANAAQSKNYTPYELKNINFVKGNGKPVAAIDSVGGADAGGGKIVLGKDALEGGSIVVRGDVTSLIGCKVQKAQVSTDNGSSWKDAPVSNGVWSYSFAPRAGSYAIKAKAFDEKNTESDATPAVEMEYQVETAVAGDCKIDRIEITAEQSDVLDVSGTTVTQTSCGEAKVRIAPTAVDCDGNATYDKWALKTEGGSPKEYSAGDKADLTFTQAGSLGVELYAAQSGAGISYSAYETDVEYKKDIEQPDAAITQVGNKAVEDTGDKLTLYSDSLESGYLKVRGEAASPSGCDIKKVRVSMDNGGSWSDATVSGGGWEYRANPQQTTYNILADAEDEEGNKSDEMFQAVEVEYKHMKPEDELKNVFAELMQAYVGKNTTSFMDLTSGSFSSPYAGIEDNKLLETSLENKFTAYSTIALKYKVTNTVVTGDTGRVSMTWSADTGTSGYPYSSTFLFEREPEWKFTSVEDPNTFLRYTSEVKTISIAAAKTTLIADEADNTTITVTVRDSAQNLIKDGTTIYFTADKGAISGSAKTESGIAALTYTAGNGNGTATITARSDNGVSAAVSLTLQPERAPLPPAAK